MASKYFSDEELMCHGACQGDCDCGIESAQNVNPRLFELLDQLRENVGGPLSLSCAYRCESHNAAVGGCANSQHVQGNAADVLCPDYLTIGQLKWYVEQLPFDGIGYYPLDGYENPEDVSGGFCHVDVREGGVGAGYYWEG